MVIALPDEKVKAIMCHTILSFWSKRMIKHGYSFFDNTIQELSGIFETQAENLEVPAVAVKKSSKKKEKKKNPKK